MSTHSSVNFQKTICPCRYFTIPKQTPAGWRKTKAVGGARALTSIEACCMLEEKEHKKKEVKGRQRQEREQKKLERQEEQKKKPQERATKQAER